MWTPEKSLATRDAVQQEAIRVTRAAIQKFF